MISNSRFSNANQLGIGDVVLDGQVDFRNNLFDFGVPSSNSQYIARAHNMGVSVLGTITGGSGYANGTYTGVPLSAKLGAGGATATVTVAGGAVTAVTITSPGAFIIPGMPLSTSNANLGGSGAGFSVPVLAAVSSVQDNPIVTSVGNNFGPGGQAPTWTQVGYFNFTTPAVTSINDQIDAATVPGGTMFGCGGAGAPTCIYMSFPVSSDIAPNIASLANLSSAIPGHHYGGPVVGYRTTSNVNDVASYFGFQAVPPSGDFGTAETMFEAAWNLQAISGGAGVAVLPNAYGFRTRTPIMNGGNMLTAMYGFKCDQQKVQNVTTAWCFYNDDPGDLNAFVGGTQFGTTTLATVSGEIGMAKITETTPTAPGAGGAKLAVVCGTNAGTAKLVAFAGTSTTPVTILDNIGSGVSGC